MKILNTLKIALLFILFQVFFAGPSQCQTLTNRQVFNYEVGNIFYAKYNTYSATKPPTYHLDTVLTKTWSPNQDTLMYSIKRRSYTPGYTQGVPPTVFDTILHKVYTHLDSVFDFGNLSQYGYSCYPPTDTSYAFYGSSIWEWHSNEDWLCFEPDKYTTRVGIGIGGPYYSLAWPSGPNYFRSYELLAWVKDTAQWGVMPSGQGLNNIYDDGLSFILFPSPAHRSVTVILESADREAHLTLFDLKGQPIRQLSFQNQIQTVLDISDIRNGIYFVRIETKQGISTRKLVIRH